VVPVRPRMAQTRIARIGTALFRLRSFTPVPVIALLGWRLWSTRGVAGPGGELVDSLLNGLGLLVAWAGQALRFHTLGRVRDGTSGQDPVLEARSLNTRGPYAHVRNPLYLGNLGITLGLLLVANDVWVYAIALAFFFGQYFFIIRAEEAFLLQQHGDAYAEYRRRVPRWIPRLTPAYQGRLGDRFDWARALKKEHNPFAAWSAGALLLLGWEMRARGDLSDAARLSLEIGLGTVVAFFAAAKAYKRGWLRAHPADPAR